jgi:hypothetical protein
VFDNGTNVGVNTTSPNDYIDGESGMAILRATNGRAVLSLVGTRTDAGETLGRISFTNTNSTNAGAKRLAYISGTRGTTNNSAYLEFAVANDALGAVAMTLSQTGNLGLGVTPSAWNSTLRVIEIGGPENGYIAFNPTNLQSYIYWNAYYDTDNRYKKSSQNAAAFGFTASGSYAWYNAPSGTAGNAISFTRAMTLDASGNLFLGTTSALQSTERLAVTTSNNTAIIAQYTGGAENGWASKFWNNATSGNNLLVEFATESSITARGSVRYDRSGNRLNIVGEGSGLLFTGAATFSSTVAVNGNNLTIQPTTTTTYALSVMQNAGGYLRVGRDTSTGALYGSDYAALLVSSGNYAMILGTNDTERMRITSGGNLLVGTTSDSGAKLRVSGLNQSSSFATDYGTSSIPFGSYGTFYTVSNYQNALYMVTLQYNGFTGYTAYAIIAQNDSALVIMNQVNNNAQIQVSGLNIQGKNDSGVTVSMVYKIIKIG